MVSSAADIGAFYAARIPQPRTAATLLVISADAKGIVMRPGRAPSHRQDRRPAGPDADPAGGWGET